MELELLLRQRPGKCLACNLTYGLPQVFSRHPVLNLKGVVAKVCELAGADPAEAKWELGHTQPVSNELHAIPLYIELWRLRRFAEHAWAHPNPPPSSKPFFFFAKPAQGPSGWRVKRQTP